MQAVDISAIAGRNDLVLRDAGSTRDQPALESARTRHRENKDRMAFAMAIGVMLLGVAGVAIVFGSNAALVFLVLFGISLAILGCVFVYRRVTASPDGPRLRSQYSLAMTTGQTFSVGPSRSPISNGLFATLASISNHWADDKIAQVAPEEDARLPMLDRGVSLAFLRRIIDELTALGRDIDAGQWLNGVHTTSSATDWKEFDRAKDPYCGKACCLSTGLSFVETCIIAGMTHDPITRMPYFGRMNTFVR
mmetsp:Transcript_50008/g.141300  ORF Transcript_50008/g.141300 Transcript_50008/m.141300 type:complete len:250 (+) Transcript_50008:135-884(+)